MYVCLFTLALDAGVLRINKIAGGVLIAILFVGAIAELIRQILADNRKG